MLASYFKIIIILLIIPSVLRLEAKMKSQNAFRIMSLNLHGYHPMGELKRYYEDKQGKISEAPAHIHYFNKDEFTVGSKRRVRELSCHIRALSPDIVFLQEVGAGGPHFQSKTCDDFYRRYDEDSDWENTAFRLEKKLSFFKLNYQTLPACRGNIGWFTGPGQFNDRRIVTFTDNELELGKKNVIFDHDANPYPAGILVEGFAIMVSDRIKVLDHRIMNVSYNYLGDTVFYQMAAVSMKDSDSWFLVVNVHLGHKIGNFEQLVAIRKNIIEYLKKCGHPGDFQGVVIGGDYNSRLYRPKSIVADEISEVSMVPVEIKKKGEYNFLLTGNDAPEKIQKLKDELTLLNSSTYKAWANIADTGEFQKRLDEVVNAFVDVQKEYNSGVYRIFLDMESSVEKAKASGICSPFGNFNGGCNLKNRIDFLFKTQDFKLNNAFVLYTDHTWNDLHGVTDHPGIFAEYISL